MYPNTNKPRTTKPYGNAKPAAKPAKGQAYKGEHAELDNGFRMTEREKMLSSASQLGRIHFYNGMSTEFLPDPVKCDLDMMEAFNQGYAIAKIASVGFSRYTVGNA